MVVMTMEIAMMERRCCYEAVHQLVMWDCDTARHATVCAIWPKPRKKDKGTSSTCQEGIESGTERVSSFRNQ